MDEAYKFLSLFYDKLCKKYPQFKIVLKNKIITIELSNSKPIPFLLYFDIIDEMELYFIEKEPITLFDKKGGIIDTIFVYKRGIDKYKIDYYNINNKQLDYIIDNLFSGVIQREYELLKDLAKDFK